MVSFPEHLVRSPVPMSWLPDPPKPGTKKQLSYYFVEARRCSCCKDPPTRYFVRSVHGKLLSMSMDWRRLCHMMNWWPMEGLPANAPIPREAPKPPNKPVPKTIVIDHGPRPLFEGMDL